jgi:hypothetical protein
MARTILLGFVCGFVAVLVFHQGTIAILHQATSLFPNPPYPMRAVPPLGVPQFVSLAFWGGLYGILIAFAAQRAPRLDLLLGVLIGGVLATLVGWTLVAALRGNPLFAGFDVARWWRPLLLNGAFGWGTALLLRAARGR